MRLLLVLTTDPACGTFPLLSSLIKEALSRGHKIDAVYLTKDAVAIASPHFALGSEEMQLQDKLYRLSIEGEFPILVCGKAYRSAGLPHSHLGKGMMLSGYAELSRCLLDADKVIEL